jgi:hypothetical protein
MGWSDAVKSPMTALLRKQHCCGKPHCCGARWSCRSSAAATKKVSIAAPPLVNRLGSGTPSALSTKKNHPRRGGWNAMGLEERQRCSGTKTSGFNQAHLIPAGGEFPALITLYNDTTTGFDPDHAGTNPAKGCGLQHLDHISGLKIQLHVREGKTAGQTGTEVQQSTFSIPFMGSETGLCFRPLGTSNAPWRT